MLPGNGVGGDHAVRTQHARGRVVDLLSKSEKSPVGKQRGGTSGREEVGGLTNLQAFVIDEKECFVAAIVVAAAGPVRRYSRQTDSGGISRWAAREIGDEVVGVQKRRCAETRRPIRESGWCRT